MIRRRILLGVAFVALFALGWWVGRGRATGGDLYANLDLFVEVLHKVDENYVDSVDPAKLIEGALKGMFRDLDPYSQYLDSRAYANLQSATRGSFGGIGIVVSVRDNYPTVISPVEGSPAWQAGLRSGDVIVKIDGKSAEGLTVEEVADRLRGAQGTRVSVTIAREGDEEQHDYTLERKVIVTKSVPYAFVVDERFAYVRLANFSENSGSEVRAAVERMRGQGAHGLILDLRSNPGGLLDQAVDVAEQFVPSGTMVVYTRGRAQAQDTRYYASEPRPELEWPMVVLVDGGSASASEIVAGALQDLDRALLIGHTSFGKGSVQTVFPLHERNVALRLTTARYYTPSGRSIHRAAHDTLADTGDEEGTEPPPAAPPDSTPRPAYRTAGGRLVYGGGGITPDVTVLADTLPPLTRRVEQRGLAFRFANRWVNTHPGGKPGAALTEAMWREFADWLRAEKLRFEAADLARERVPLERALRRELARRLSGDEAAVRVALEGDAVFARALAALERARTPRDVFAAGGATVPEATPAARR